MYCAYLLDTIRILFKTLKVVIVLQAKPYLYKQSAKNTHRNQLGRARRFLQPAYIDAVRFGMQINPVDVSSFVSHIYASPLNWKLYPATVIKCQDN